MHFFFYACFFSFLAIICAAGKERSGCLEKEKALALLETAEGLLSKASEGFPSCKEDLNSTNTTDCEDEKPLAYIEISKKLISDVRENFPECPKKIEIDDRITPNPDWKEDITTPNPIEEDDKPKDCSEILASGRNESGVYTIWLNETNTTEKPLQVYCDMNTDNGGWTVIQRRGKYPVQQDFYQDWEDYEIGFGNVTEEFWLGNENIQVLCQQGCEIRFDLQDVSGEKGFALYQNFRLLGKSYKLEISDYTGNVGDGMTEHNNFGFSTKDHALIERAQKYRGGWWYRDMDYYSNLNGIFQPGERQYQSAFWYTWKKEEGLARVEMKVRPHET